MKRRLAEKSEKLIKPKGQKDIDRRKAKRSLGLKNCDPLPICGHRDLKKAKKFRAEGDSSHFEYDHSCPLCSCKQIAGEGTDHLGVGWCREHERLYTKTNAKRRVEAMTIAIREGYPNRVHRYMSNDATLQRIQEEAKEANERISLRENQLLLISLTQRILTYFEQGGKKGEIEVPVKDADGVEIEGEFTTVPVFMTGDNGKPASDIAMLSLLDRMLNTANRMAKAEFEISSAEYVHMDDCKAFFGEIMRVVSTKATAEQMKEILEEIRAIPQPRTGRK